MKTLLKYAACLLAILSLAGCNKKELYTHEELYGAPISLKVDWAGASPTASTLHLHVWSATEGIAVDTLFDLASDATTRLVLPEAEYAVTAMHDAAHVRFDGECFCLEADAEGLLAEPGEFSAGTGVFHAVAQQENAYSLQLFPFTRRLALRFSLGAEADGRIASIGARLSGVASARRLADRATTRDGAGAVAIALECESGAATYAGSSRAEGAPADGIYFSGSRNLLGIHTLERQVLTLTLHYTNGEEDTLEQDLTAYLRDFNNHTPGQTEDLTLNGEITIAGQLGLTVAIGPWIDGEGDEGDAGMEIE